MVSPASSSFTSEGAPIHELVAAQARRRPSAVALRSEQRVLTYAELDRRATALATRLQRLGVGPDVVVGVLTPRSFDLVVAQLAVLRAGGAYLPVDPAYPAQRRAFLIADAGARILLTTRDLAGEAPDRAARVIVVEDEPVQAGASVCRPRDRFSSQQLAYVIYTSGSTGRPKGVQVTHAGLNNLVAWHGRAFDVTPADRATIVAGIGFDAFVWELWPYLAAGASVAIPDEMTRASPSRLRDWLVDNRITITFAPTILAERLLAQDWPADTQLRILLTGGDRLHGRPPRGLPFRLVNNYGPTECSVVTTSTPVIAGAGAPPIGRPIGGAHILVVDERARPVAPGTPGELLIGGAGVARGYAGRPDLTAERFVPDPSSRGERAYRTGDLVRELRDGQLEFLGRIDDQVKVRGHRIEPREIETVLAQHADVASAVVVARPDATGDLRLVAYCTASDDRVPRIPELRAHLASQLPRQLVPEAVVVLGALPVTQNGKVDRAALPDPLETLAVGPGDEAVPARTATEAGLLAIWREVLQRDDFGVEHDFLELGGHSLAAAQIAGRLNERYGVEIGLEPFFGELTVERLATTVDLKPASGSTRLPVPTGERGPAVPTAAQQRLWFLHQFFDPALYNVSLVFDLRGDLDLRALALSLGELVRRHEVLRTAVQLTEEGQRQVLQPATEIPVATVDLRALSADTCRARADRAIDEATRAPFDLARPPLLRALLLRDGDSAWRLLLTIHHIAFDGWSTTIVADELAALYGAFHAGRAPELRALPVQFSDVAAWERDTLTGETLEGLLTYWKGCFATPFPPAPLPTDRPRPAAGAGKGRTVTRPMDPGLVEAAAALGRQERATLFMAVLAALAVVQHRHAGVCDLVVGTPVANRPRPEFERLIGCFVNTLPLRCDLSGRPSFREVLRRVRRVALDGFAHQALPFDRLVDAIGLQRDAHGRAPFQAMLVVQPTPAPPATCDGLEIRFAEELHLDTARFDLTVVLEFRRSEPVLSVEYDAELFERSTVERLVDNLVSVLGSAIEDPDDRVDEIALMPDVERRRVLALGRGETTAPVDLPLAHILVEASARRHPDRLAVTCDHEGLTYRELDARANALAWRLRDLGVRPERPVAVCLGRSLASVACMLAVFKSGGVYVPLDPHHPDHRLRQTLEDVGPAVLVSSEDLAGRLGSLGGDCAATVVTVDGGGILSEGGRRDDDPPALATSEHLAYVIATSGSTGRPKGVLLEHRGLHNLVRGKIDRFDVRPGSRVLQYVSFGFGVSVADVFMTLAVGATLVVRGGEAPVGRELSELVRRERISHLVVPASVLATLPDEELPTLKVIAVGGEPCGADLVDRWAGGRRFVQAYGPTEATVCATTARCRPEGGPPPVGRPLPNVDVFILDSRLEPVPAGAVGELFIGGAGVGRGYVAQPALTAERFVPDPFGVSQEGRPARRLYRTGDLARFCADGSVAVLDRIDEQVQLRGQRVELEDVEAALRACTGLREVAAAVHRHVVGGQLLAGHVVTEGRPLPRFDELRRSLRERLPDYLVPAVIVPIDALPRTASGKVDRRALPEPVAPVPSAGRPAHTVTETILAEIWTEVLESDRQIGIDDDFFAIGGQSILAARVTASIRDRFEVGLPVRALFEAPTIAALALRVEQMILEDLQAADALARGEQRR